MSCDILIKIRQLPISIDINARKIKYTANVNTQTIVSIVSIIWLLALK